MFVGTTAERLIESVKVLSHGAVYGKFFHMYPDRELCVRRWLSHWIQKGGILHLSTPRQPHLPLHVLKLILNPPTTRYTTITYLVKDNNNAYVYLMDLKLKVKSLFNCFLF